MNVSPDLMSSTISAAGTQSPPSITGDNHGPPDHATTVQSLGGTLSQDAKDALLAGVNQLEEAGAPFDTIKSYVDSKLEASGIDVSGGNHRSGQLVDIMS